MFCKLCENLYSHMIIAHSIAVEVEASHVCKVVVGLYHSRFHELCTVRTSHFAMQDWKIWQLAKWQYHS